jgi:hypothetical protein
MRSVAHFSPQTTPAHIRIIQLFLIDLAKEGV